MRQINKIILGLMLFINFANALPVMKKSELAMYDGKNGHKSYVALQGKVYDVSKIPAWANGKHHKGMHAGTDLTPYIDSSPHGAAIIEYLKLKPVALYK